MKLIYVSGIFLALGSSALASISLIDLVLKKEKCSALSASKRLGTAKVVEVCKRKAFASSPEQQYLVPQFALFSVAVKSERGIETRIYRLDQVPQSRPLFYYVGNLRGASDLLVGGGPDMDVPREDGYIHTEQGRMWLSFLSLQGAIPNGAVVEVSALDLLPAN